MRTLFCLVLASALFTSFTFKSPIEPKKEVSSKKLCGAVWYVTNNHSNSIFASARFTGASSDIWDVGTFIYPGTPMELIWFTPFDPTQTGQPVGNGNLRVTLAQTTGQSGCVKVYLGTTLVTSQPWSSATGVTVVNLYIPVTSCGYFEIVIDNGPC